MTTTVAGDKPSRAHQAAAAGPLGVAEKPTLVALWRTAIGRSAGIP
ncbi:hypothetical protein [Kribbella sp. VKM Ac-2568]|nr:hypothetical protein [Kribbella sp. VKM Ac-2568]TCM38537.1 hypothetical protein EV648_11651 [Kribbella sp. VKM Ac-2568]